MNSFSHKINNAWIDFPWNGAIFREISNILWLKLIFRENDFLQLRIFREIVKYVEWESVDFICPILKSLELISRKNPNGRKFWNIHIVRFPIHRVKKISLTKKYFVKKTI